MKKFALLSIFLQLRDEQTEEKTCPVVQIITKGEQRFNFYNKPITFKSFLIAHLEIPKDKLFVRFELISLLPV